MRRLGPGGLAFGLLVAPHESLIRWARFVERSRKMKMRVFTIVALVISLAISIIYATPVNGTAQLTTTSTGYFYVLTRDGIIRISPTGEKQTIVGSHGESHSIEILDSELYVSNATYGGDILVYDLNGNYRRTIPTPSQASQYLTFEILPDRRIALLDNGNDKVYFINSSGGLLATTNILDSPDLRAQYIGGVVVNNQLIISDDGYNRLLRIDLNTYGKSIFKDLSSLPRWLGAITYAGGQYYVCGPQQIYTFYDGGSVIKAAEIPEFNITGIVVMDDFAYVSANFAGKIYKVDLNSGTSNILTSGLNYPKDIEYQEVINPVVGEARLDIGMPYNTNRGCPSPNIGCGGPYHGFYAGACTDLAIDAYQYGVPFELAAAVRADYQANPHDYWYGSARNAHDMHIYFQHTGQILSHAQSYEAGDIAFFRWSSGNWHVGVISELDGNNSPTAMVHAPGCGLSCTAFEQNWNNYYTTWSQGHGRLNSTVGNIVQISNIPLQTLVLSVDAPATIKLFDSQGNSTSDEFDEDLVASNIEAYIPYIPGGQFKTVNNNTFITVTQPLSNTMDYFVQVTGVSDGDYHLNIQTIQDGNITVSETFTQAITVGDIHSVNINLDASGGMISFSAYPPTLSPLMTATPGSIELAGLTGTTVAFTITIAEADGQQPLSGVEVSVTNIENQIGREIAGSSFMVIPASFDIQAGDSQSVQIVIDLANIIPGLYQGGLIVTSSNGGTQSIPLSLMIEPLEVFLPLVISDTP